MNRSSPPSDSAASDDSPLLEGLSDEQRDRLADLLDQFLSALESGAPLDAEELAARNPDLREPLKLYLARLDELHEVSAGFASREAAVRGGRDDATLDDEAADSSDDGADRDDEAPDGSLPPSARRLGDFLLGDEIGRGGMGIVYEARQISLDRRVALKVLPFASILDARTIARFKNEAKAAAQLQHPHIVPVFAVGAERGVHYYAMQFIEGRPLDQLLDQVKARLAPAAEAANADPSDAEPRQTRRKSAHRATRDRASPGESTVAAPRPRADGAPLPRNSAIERLSRRDVRRQEYYLAVANMGVQAAEALAAAHQEGIVHRDIKPSNLLFDHEGQIWVTDFGLARMQSDSKLSRTGDVVGTWRYMSPEQARGESPLIDHRTDIYSLGATLWEMLALRPAYEDDDRAALLRQLSLGFPPRLAPHCPELPTDLETVVLKAMSHEREDRYQTADEFAADLRRVLEGKRPLARPPSLVDRLLRLARRHRRFVVAASLGVVIIAAVSTTSAVLTLRARNRADRNFQRAKGNFDKARRIVDHLGARWADQLSELPGAASLRRDLLQDTLQYYQGFVREAGDDPELQEDIALTYSKIGGLVGEFGSNDEAVQANLEAIQRFERLLVQETGSIKLRRAIAEARRQLGDAYREAGEVALARQACEKAVKLDRQLVLERRDDADLQRELAAALESLAVLLTTLGPAERDEARQLLAESIQITRRLCKEFPESADDRRRLAASLNRLGEALGPSEASEALRLHQQALAQLGGSGDHPETVRRFRRELAKSHALLGVAEGRLQRLDDAADALRRAIELWQPMLEQDPQLASIGRELAAAWNGLGRVLTRQASLDDADAAYARAIELQAALVQTGRIHQQLDLQLVSALASMHANRGVLRERQQRPDDAIREFEQAVQLQREAFETGGKVKQYRNLLDSHYVNYGRLLRSSQDYARAALVAQARKSLWPDAPGRLQSVAEDFQALADAVADSDASAVELAAEYRRRSDDILKEAEAVQAARRSEVGDDPAPEEAVDVDSNPETRTVRGPSTKG